MKRVWIQVGIFGAALTILVFYYFYLHMEWTNNEVMNRAQIARMLALMRYDSDECEEILDTTDHEGLPVDVSESEWYTKYVVTVLKEGWMNADEEGFFYPGKALTYGELINLMKCFRISEKNLSFSLKFHQLDGMVSKKQWCEVFRLISVDHQRVQKVKRTIYGTPTNMTELEPWQVMTDDGIKNGEGLAVDDYINQTVEIYEADDEILCIIERISDTVETDNGNKGENSIRVLLHESKDDYEHEEVRVTSNQPFFVISGQDVWKYGAGAEVVFERDDPIFNENQIVLKPESGDGRIEVLSLERACGVPSYCGGIHLQKGENGIIVVNEVDIEDYVAGVISSEMPSSYGIEALKAQAVCARTYAKSALDKKYLDYPANVDDTVNSQVYNNHLATDKSIQAGKETRGMVLRNEAGLTPTYFFSTSCGHTSAPEDVWYDGQPSNEKEDVTVFLSNETVELDLSQETEFREFINLEEEITYFEEDLPWFRWRVFINDEDIESKVENICDENIGDLQKITVISRAESGVLKTIRIEGDEGACLVHGEYRIRHIFSPSNAELRSQNGDVFTGWSMLPSGYFYMDALIENGVCEGYLLRGGGYGHGCGMSQNGAMKMAEMGKSYEEILKYFFTDSEVVAE